MNKRFFYFLSAVFIFVSCQTIDKQTPVKIAISKATPLNSYHNYIRWIHSIDSTIQCIDMYSLGIDSALIILEECDGLLLTGGEDIYPKLYGEVYDSVKCNKPNRYRDSIEMVLIEKAFALKMPIQGICRGHQLINVYFGGTLIFDIPTDLDTIVKHRLPKTYECLHEIRIEEGSLLESICQVSSGISNSNHHQGVKKLAPDLIAQGFTPDGLIESIAYNNMSYPYLLGVQWHPERMDYKQPLSGSIATKFVEEVKIYANEN